MQEKLPKRNEVPKELTWRLEDIYETPKLWEVKVVGDTIIVIL